DDAFLAKFDSNGIEEWATYYGGSKFDIGNSVLINKADDVYLIGFTSSDSGIANGHALQNFSKGSTDVFIAKFNRNGLLQWGTYYGGNNTDQAEFAAADIWGNFYISGVTVSDSLATANAYQTTLKNSEDAFI